MGAMGNEDCLVIDRRLIIEGLGWCSVQLLIYDRKLRDVHT